MKQRIILNKKNFNSKILIENNSINKILELEVRKKIKFLLFWIKKLLQIFNI